jgi:hypothetical protein
MPWSPEIKVCQIALQVILLVCRIAEPRARHRYLGNLFQGKVTQSRVADAITVRGEGSNAAKGIQVGSQLAQLKRPQV